MARKIALIAFILFVLIQFFKPRRNISTSAHPASIASRYQVPDQVGSILKRACFDCHSNNTRYPWYSSIQPVAWYLSYHVNDGKKELNFDEFSSYTFKKQDHKLEEIAETVEKGEMPLDSYTLLHRDAVLTPEERQLIVNWANRLRGEIRGKMTASVSQP
ncbi:MAG TPA: heme-binding domain-containing protein [Sphingobacteriaceae bacterium]